MLLVFLIFIVFVILNLATTRFDIVCMAGGEFTAFDEKHLDSQQNEAQCDDNDSQNHCFHHVSAKFKCKYSKQNEKFWQISFLFCNLVTEKATILTVFFNSKEI